MAVDWKQNAEDVEEILCDAGDLFQECHEVLHKCGQVECAEKVRKFCARVNQSMLSGEPFRKLKEVMPMTEPDPNEATQKLAIAIGALIIFLIDKGIITQGEYDKAYAQATVIIDQEFARKRDERKET